MGLVRLAIFISAVASSIVLLAAGFLKGVDLFAFLMDLRQWKSVPLWLAAIATPLIPVVEIVFGAMFVLGLRRRVAAFASVSLVAILSAAYLFEYSQGGTPSCGCFGALSRASGVEGDLVTTLVRNGLMASAWIGWLATATASQSTASVGVATDDRLHLTENQASAVPVGRAFSLIEVLVVILIVAVLLAITLPSITNFRRNSAKAVMASDLRQHATIFSAYSNDFRGFLPYFTDPVNSPMSFTEPVSGINLPQTFYFDASWMWTLALSQSYYAGNVNDPTFQPPNERTGRRDRAMSYFGYMYPCVFITDPLYFSGDRRDDRSQLRGTQLSEVLFPSDKTLIVNQRWYSDPTVQSTNNPHSAASPSIHVAMTDTAWVSIPPERYIVHQFGDGWDLPLTRDVGGTSSIASHTTLGVRGRDRR